MSTEPENDFGEHMRQILSGGFSGVITRLITQPLDVLKIRFQLQVEPIERKANTTSKYRSIPQAIRTIYHEEGVYAFWKGHNAAQVLSIFYGLSQFWTYEQLKIIMDRNQLLENNNNLKNFICGAASGATATLGSTPFDVVRTRLIGQDRSKGYYGMMQGVRNIFQTEGFYGLYRGTSSSMAQMASLLGFNFMIFHFLAGFSMAKLQVHKREELPAIVLLACGATSGMLSKTIVYPLDLIKKRLQIQGFEAHRQTFGRHFRCGGVFSCVKYIIKDEGIGGLYKGMEPTILKSAATTALYFSLYEKIKRLMRIHL